MQWKNHLLWPLAHFGWTQGWRSYLQCTWGRPRSACSLLCSSGSVQLWSPLCCSGTWWMWIQPWVEEQVWTHNPELTFFSVVEDGRMDGWWIKWADGVSHLEVSLYCIAPKRIPDSLTELAKGLTIPARKPFTCRKLARPILEDPSIRKTISAACTLLHVPAKNTSVSHMWEKGGVVFEKAKGIIHTLSFSPFNGGQEENHCEHAAPHLHNLKGKTPFYLPHIITDDIITVHLKWR